MYLKNEFDREDGGEDEIEFIEYSVSYRLLANWILGGQSNTTRADHYHNEQIEVSQVDDEMAETTNSVTQ